MNTTYSMTAKPLQHTKLEASKAKGVSISASIICILVYISVFYIFNLSPSLIFNSTKFWFIFSNTLIIIIAADYGSFSSSSDKPDDPYDVYVSKSRPPISPIQAYYNTTPLPLSPLQFKNSYVVENKTIDAQEEQVTKDVVVDAWTVPTQDSIWESISKEADDKVQNEEAYDADIDRAADEKKVTKCRRTVSEKLPATDMMIDESKNVIHRWESARHDPLVEEQESEGSEFAAMTDEELNRRVEEFIQKFNRHIRLERHINFCTRV